MTEFTAVFCVPSLPFFPRLQIPTCAETPAPTMPVNLLTAPPGGQRGMSTCNTWTDSGWVQMWRGECGYCELFPRLCRCLFENLSPVVTCHSWRSRFSSRKICFTPLFCVNSKPKMFYYYYFCFISFAWGFIFVCELFYMCLNTFFICLRLSIALSVSSLCGTVVDLFQQKSLRTFAGYITTTFLN